MAFLFYLLYILAVIIGWVIFYYVVKAAVKNAILETQYQKRYSKQVIETKPEVPSNSQQRDLQKQYDNNEISFEVYQAEWEKLKS